MTNTANHLQSGHMAQTAFSKTNLSATLLLLLRAVLAQRGNGSTSDVFGKVTPVDDAHMYWTHGCGWDLWGSGQKESRGLAADPTQHLPADADLWSESTD